MIRTADYTIQGFLYQFNKTILEILNASNESSITVEGIIEDIDINEPSGIKAIQCKYHEGQNSFSLSLIYKPILQMMTHFHKNSGIDVQYKLFAYFPSETKGTRQIKKDEIDLCLKSKNKELEQYIVEIRDKINIEKFCIHCSLEFGENFDSMTRLVCKAFRDNGIPNEDIDTLVYPNAINIIANLSIKHNASDRKTTKTEFINTLQQIRTTAISRWTLSLKNVKKLLEARKKQLKPNLDKNVRLRYFFFQQTSIENFTAEIVLFICEYLDKYHFKPSHLKTPLFCFDCKEKEFTDIQIRLHQKGIIATDGFVASHFDEAYFFREPLSCKQVNKEIKREFKIRLLRYPFPDNFMKAMNEHKCDDLFIIGINKYEEFNQMQDVNIEHLEAENLLKLRYLLGVSNVYE